MRTNKTITLYSLLFEDDTSSTDTSNTNSNKQEAELVGNTVKDVIDPIAKDVKGVVATTRTTARQVSQIKTAVGAGPGGNPNPSKATPNTSTPNPGNPSTTLSTKGGTGGSPPVGAKPTGLPTEIIPSLNTSSSKSGKTSGLATLDDLESIKTDILKAVGNK
jgi:hypothetical protein